MDAHPELIATVPLQLAEVFKGYGSVRMMAPPVPLPPFALNQHWHSRFHHDPAIIWLRALMKETFENYPDVWLGDRAVHAAPAPARKPRRARKT